MKRMQLNNYRIIEFRIDGDNKTIETGLSLEEAQEHCQDPETSSSTCTAPHRKQKTKDIGKWFHGYTNA